jgi:capsid protein
MEKPYKINDRRGTNPGKPFDGNRLYQAAQWQQYNDRRRITNLENDTPRNINAYGRRMLSSIGRWLYANSPIVTGAVDEIARYAAQNYTAQFYGQDRAWGQAAESWLYENDRYVDIRGWPYTFQTYAENLVRGAILDGDTFTLLTQDDADNGKIQSFISGRIGSREMQTTIKGGPYDGYLIRDGVVLDEFATAVAYQILGDVPEQDRIVSSNSLFPSFLPKFPDQERGISVLGATLFDFQDASESRRFELLAQKLAASYGMVIENEDGEADPGKNLLVGSSGTLDSSGNAATAWNEKVDGVGIHYFKAGTNSKISSVTADRPSGNQQAFEDRIIRAALAGMGWSFDFALDPTKAGGAQMRIVIAKINRTLKHYRSMLLEPACRRVTGYRIAKAINNGQLPANPEWFKWSFVGAADLTADEKYSSDVSVQELRAGLTDEQTEIGKRGEWWQDVIERKIEVEKYLQERCKAEGVDANRIVLLTPNGNPPQPPAETKETP